MTDGRIQIVEIFNCSPFSDKQIRHSTVLGWEPSCSSYMHITCSQRFGNVCEGWGWYINLGEVALHCTNPKPNPRSLSSTRPCYLFHAKGCL